MVNCKASCKRSIDCLTASVSTKLKGITTNKRTITVSVKADRLFPVLLDNFRCTGYRTKEKITAQSMGFIKGKSITKAKKAKKTVIDMRKYRNILSFTGIDYKVWKGVQSVVIYWKS